jgi:hypothetical protein
LKPARLDWKESKAFDGRFVIRCDYDISGLSFYAVVVDKTTQEVVLQYTAVKNEDEQTITFSYNRSDARDLDIGKYAWYIYQVEGSDVRTVLIEGEWELRQW